ncbi:hypothetical protein M758_12G099800 [Ceratodon purpureus]|nr:hypothetical protein M758_12G099800 [Ceratodon purpureus]
MEIQLQSGSTPAQEGPSSSLGWPFGLPTCMVIHTPADDRYPANCKELARAPLPFQQQFMNLQTTFLLPFFSDGGSSSSSDTDSRSEAASSFFKDSRRITLGSLIGLPMDHSFHALHPDAHYHIFTDADVFHDRRRTFLPSCGILELLGCLRNSASTSREFELSEDGELDDAAVTANSTSLTAYLQTNPTSETGCINVMTFEEALSDGSQSPDWNDQFVSCHSMLSEAGGWTPVANGAACGHVGEHVATPVKSSSTPRQLKPSASNRKMQRSSSMKSFFSSICCRIDAVERS